MPKLRMKLRRIAPIIILSSVLVLTTFSASAQDARIQVVGSLTSLIDVAVGSAKEHSPTLRNPGTEPAHAVVRTLELAVTHWLRKSQEGVATVPGYRHRRLR